MKLPSNIVEKLEAVCESDKEACNTLKILLENELNEKAKINQLCRETVEKYIGEKNNEN